MLHCWGSEIVPTATKRQKIMNTSTLVPQYPQRIGSSTHCGYQNPKMLKPLTVSPPALVTGPTVYLLKKI